MRPARKSGEAEPAARAKRALEDGATTLGAQLARSVQGGWRRMSPSRRARLEQLAANVKQRAREQRGGVEPESTAPAPPAANVPRTGAPVVSAAGDREVSEVEVHDLRADLARELERLADASITATRGPGGVAGEAASADGQA